MAKKITKQGNTIVVTDTVTGKELFDHLIADTYPIFTEPENGEAVVDLKGILVKEKINTFKVSELENENGDSFNENDLGLQGAKEYLRGLLGFKGLVTEPITQAEYDAIPNVETTPYYYFIIEE